MILVVQPHSLRSLESVWEETASSISAQSGTLTEVGGGAGNFGRINQFMTPALHVFVWAAKSAVKECGEQLREGALASRDTADDMEKTDTEVATMMGGGSHSCP